MRGRSIFLARPVTNDDLHDIVAGRHVAADIQSADIAERFAAFWHQNWRRIALKLKFPVAENFHLCGQARIAAAGFRVVDF